MIEIRFPFWGPGHVVLCYRGASFQNIPFSWGPCLGGTPNSDACAEGDGLTHDHAPSRTGQSPKLGAHFDEADSRHTHTGKINRKVERFGGI